MIIYLTVFCKMYLQNYKHFCMNQCTLLVCIIEDCFVIHKFLKFYVRSCYVDDK